MGWTPQGSKVVGSGPQVRAVIDASALCLWAIGRLAPTSSLKHVDVDYTIDQDSLLAHTDTSTVFDR